MSYNTVRQILFDLIDATHEFSNERWDDHVSATIERLKMRAHAGDFGKVSSGDRLGDGEYILESEDELKPRYRILKHQATGDFSEYRCIIETRSPAVASTLMHALADGELEL